MNIRPINPNPSSFKPNPMYHTFVDENLVKLNELKTDQYCPICGEEHTPEQEPEILTPEEQETFMHLLAKAMHGMIASVRHDENSQMAQYLKAVTNPFTTTEMVKTPEQIESDYLEDILAKTPDPEVNYGVFFKDLDKYFKDTPNPASYISPEPPMTYKKPDAPIADYNFEDIKTPESEAAPPVSPWFDDTPGDIK